MYYDIARMTPDEIAAKLNQGVDLVLLPVGATENHGYGCPMGTDSLVLEAVGRKVAERLQCFFAPVLPYGMSSNHMSFKGTMTLSGSTLALVVKELLASLVQHGFRKLVVLNGHAGNTAAIEVACREMKDRYPHLLFAHVKAWDGIRKSPIFNSLLQELGGLHPREFGSHGGLMELAVAMAYRPEDVKLDKCVLADVSKVVANEESTVKVVVNVEEYSESGAFGTAKGCSVELGQRIIEASADQIARDISRAVALFGSGGA